MYRDAQFKNCWRELEVSYIFGRTGSGKTRGVMDAYGYENCYRVTDYKHPFDTYDGQDVLIFEEFRGSLKHGDMLNYLDGCLLYTSGIPYHEVEALARVLLLEIQAFFESEDGQREYAEWKAKQQAEQENKVRCV